MESMTRGDLQLYRGCVSDRCFLDALNYFGPPTLGIESPSPHRLTLAAVDGSAFESLPAEDKKWLAEQSARFPGSSDGNGISSEVDMGLLTFETINFMNGKRSTKKISLLLSAEFLVDIDEGWVNRMVGILEKQGLVTTKPN